MMNERRLCSFLWVLGLAAATVLSAASLFLGDLNQDEGWYLYGARLVAEGRRPYIDFATTQGPVMSYVYALADPLVRHWGVAGGRGFTSVLGLLGVLAAAWLAARLARVTLPPEAPPPVPGTGGDSRPAQAALATLYLAGVNVFQSYFTTIVKTYALTALLLLLGFLCLTAVLGRRGRLAATAAGALLMLAAATRISAVMALAATGLALLLAHDLDRRSAWIRAAWFAAGAGLTGCAVFLPFLVAAPDSLWFCLVQYHAGREVAGLLPWLAYKGGFVARLCLAYAVAAGVAVALFARLGAAAWRGWRANVLTTALWGSVVAVSLVHLSAPFPYDDYQAMLYPLLAVLLAVALVNQCRAFWGVLAVCLTCLVAAGSSPILQSWFIGPRDRIWWPLKAKAPLTVLRETAAHVRALPGVRPGAEILTQDPYLAVEADLRLPPGLELGQFCYFPDWSDAQAGRGHVLNAAAFRHLLRTSTAPVAAFSGYGFAIRSPGVQPLPEAERAELWDILNARYDAAFAVEPFGQADTRLQVFTRSPGRLQR
ncbi:MAG: hypothetical protein K8T26_18760 [Lentisphaerae bacterium]|nr:hypothetical protein [Lentisphaerota bacterium]